MPASAAWDEVTVEVCFQNVDMLSNSFQRLQHLLNLRFALALSSCTGYTPRNEMLRQTGRKHHQSSHSTYFKALRTSTIPFAD